MMLPIQLTHHGWFFPIRFSTLHVKRVSRVRMPCLCTEWTLSVAALRSGLSMSPPALVILLLLEKISQERSLAPAMIGRLYGKQAALDPRVPVCIECRHAGRGGEVYGIGTCTEPWTTGLRMLDATSDAQTSQRSKRENVRFVRQGEQIQDRQTKAPIRSNVSPPYTRIRDTITTTRGRGGQDNNNAPQLRVVTYNPTTVKHEGRLNDICRHFKHAACREPA